MRNEPEPTAWESATREITIVNKLGLHARPAAEFVRCASQFRSEIFLLKESRQFSASSATLRAHGPDAE